MAIGGNRVVSLATLMTGAVVLVCVAPAMALAQAWLPEKGEGSISTGVQIFHVTWHFERDGSQQEEVNIQIRNVTAEGTYGLTDKVAIGFGLPYVASRFGAVSHPCPEPVPGYLPCAFAESPTIDDGKYYATFQDFRANVRYAMWRRHFTMTPSVGVVLPSRNYDTHGHAAPGRHLRELDLALYAGRLLGPFLPNTYVHGSYTYAVVQHVVHHDLDVSLNRSNAEGEIGHQLTPKLSVQAVVNWQRTHGGLEWVDELFQPGSVHEEIHDQAAKASYWRAGVGAAYSVNESLGISFSLLRTLSGKNTHRVSGVAIGTTWSFGQGSGMIGARSSQSPGAARQSDLGEPHKGIARLK